MKATRAEAIDSTLKEFYDRLLGVLREPAVRDGRWQLLECVPAWEGKLAHDCFVALAWQCADNKHLIAAVNYARNQSQCYVRHPFADLRAGQWRLQDHLRDLTLRSCRRRTQVRRTFIWMCLPGTRTSFPLSDCLWQCRAMARRAMWRAWLRRPRRRLRDAGRTTQAS